MDEEVIISGITLSFLLSGISNSAGDAEGILFGKTTKVSYKERDNSNLLWRTSFVVQGSLLTGSSQSFYSPDGVLDLPAFQQVVGTRTPIGWFRFRRGLPLLPTAREAEVHQSLTSHLGGQPLLFAVLTHSVTLPTLHVHSLDYKFLHFADAGAPQALSVSITNMMQSSEEEYASFHPLSSATSLADSAPPLLLDHNPTISHLEALIKSSLAKMQNMADQIHQLESN